MLMYIHTLFTLKRATLYKLNKKPDKNRMKEETMKQVKPLELKAAGVRT